MRAKTTMKRMAALLAGACLVFGGCTPTEPLADGGEHVHDWQETSRTDATCTAGGMIYYACGGCEETKQEPIPAKGHAWELKNDVEPTCLTDGYTEYICTECGDSKRENEQEAKGHDFKAEITQESTCQSVEITTYSCKNCDFSYTEKTKDVSAHSWLETEHEDGVYTCKVCGVREVRYAEPVRSGEAVTGTINSGATASYRETVFNVKADRSGIYRLNLDFTAETYIGTVAIFNNTAADGNKNAMFTDGKAILADSSLASDAAPASGYNKNGYEVYLTEGENELKLMTAAGTANVGDAGEIVLSGVRLELVEEIDSLAVFENTHARNLLTYGVGYGPYLICGSGQTVVASTTTLSVPEDGLYEFSYFGAGANSGHAGASEIYFTLTKEENGVLHRITMRSDGLPAVTDYTYMHDLNVYTGTEKAEDVLVHKGSYECYTGGEKGGRSVFLSAGDWTVTVGAYDHTGDSKAFVMFGCGLFAKRTEGTHEHSYQHTVSVPASCTQTGLETYTCAECGDTYSEVSYGHSYSDSTIEAGDRKVCELCGVQEYNLEAPAKSTAESYNVSGSVGKYYTETFTVKADKAGVYRLYLRYSVKKSETAAEDVNISDFYAGIVNKTFNEELQAESGQGMQSFNVLTNDASVPAAYAEAAGGYNASYFSVYLLEGDNELCLHLSDCTDVTVTGARLELESETDLYLYTWYYTQAHWTGAYFTAGKSTLGLSVNMMANGTWNEERGGTVTIAEEGWYDVSTLVTAANGTEVELTLTNGSRTVTLKSNGLSSATESKLSTTLLTHALYDAEGEHLVYLTAGEWTVGLKAVNETASKRIAFSGGGIFFSRTGDTCEHSYEDRDVIAPTCEAAGSKKQVCTKCGAVKESILPATGHTWKETDHADGVYTCTVCNYGEVKYPSPVLSGEPISGTINTGANLSYRATEFTVNAAKSGMYQLYLNYTAGKYEGISSLFNLSIASGDANAMFTNKQTLSSDSSVASAVEGFDGYNRNGYIVYLKEGENKLRLQTTAGSTEDAGVITINGVCVKWLKQVDSVAVFKNTHPRNVLTYGTGYGPYHICGSNQSVIASTATLTITEAGLYDLSYFCEGANNGLPGATELYITLERTVDGEKQRITMRSDGMPAQTNYQYTDNLYVYTGTTLAQDNKLAGGTYECYIGGEKGDHLVELAAGEWTVTVGGYDHTGDSKAYLVFGCGLFATKVSD